MMYNHQLDTFIKVADAGSFSKASKDLFISPTAAIKQINSLENHLELKLFERTHRGLLLTEAGQSLYQDAKYLIQYSNESLVRAKNSMNPHENVIRIGTSLMTPSHFLIDLWPNVHARFPDLKFQMVSFENTPKNAAEILGNLGTTIDIVAGVFDDNYLQKRGCATLELSREPICCAMSIHHPLAKKEKLQIKDLAGEEIMVIRREWNDSIDLLRDDLESGRLKTKVRDFEFYNVDVFNQCENERNLLLAIKSWESIHPFIKVIPVEWNYTIPFGILYSPNPSERVKQFIEVISQVYGV